MEEVSINSIKYHKFAGFWTRVVATLIDGFILSLIIFPIFFTFFNVLNPVSISPNLNIDFKNLIKFQVILGFLSLIISFIYQAIFLLKFQATPGKKAVGIKVIKADNVKLTIKTVFLRELIGKWISGIVFNLGFIWVGFDSKKQGWQDKIANTYVIYNQTISKQEYEIQISKKTNKLLIFLVTILLIIFYLISIFGTLVNILFLSSDSSGIFKGYQYLKCIEVCRNSKSISCLNTCVSKLPELSSDNISKTSSGWYRYISQDSNFQIEFPSKPITTKTEVSFSDKNIPNTIQSSTFSLNLFQSEPSIYSISTYKYPDEVDLSNPKKILDKTPKFEADKTQSKLISSNDVNFHNYDSVDFVIEDKKGNSMTKAVIIDRNMYMISVISDSNVEEEFNKFIKSFKISNNDNFKDSSGDDLSYDGWIKFNSPTKDFSVYFPNQPLNKSNVKIGGNTFSGNLIYESENKRGNTFRLKVSDILNAKETDPYTILDKNINNNVVMLGGNLKSSNKSTFKGYPAEEYVISTNSGQWRIKYLSIMIKDKLFNFEMTSGSDSFPDFDRFVNSFQYAGN